MIGAPSSAGAISLAAALIGVPVVRWFCLRFGWHDSPGPLKIHSRPTPRLGGLAILLAFCIGTFLSVRSAADIYFVAALALIWVAGLIDDLRGLPAIYRLSAHVFGGMILWYGGWRVPLLGSGVFGLAAICLYVVIVVNALNFIDGSDGIAAGVTAIIAMGYIVLPGGSLPQFGSLVAWSLLGACVGFLVFNFPPAKIFMGDSGSTMLGFCVAILGLNFWRVHDAAGSPLVFPILVASFPLLDAILAVLRRFRSHGSPFHGDRFHFYDLILGRGWTPRKVALACYGITLAFVLAGLLVLRTDITQALWISALCVGALLLAALRLGSLGTRETRLRMRRVNT
jgi:UDP-GlcNAc:undecaprenyl-phosphate GlcNAc-1-phosphate transferase